MRELGLGLRRPPEVREQPRGLGCGSEREPGLPRVLPGL